VAKVFVGMVMALVTAVVMQCEGAAAQVRYTGYPVVTEYSYSDGSIPSYSTRVNVNFRARSRRLEARVGQSPWFRTISYNAGRSVKGISSVFGAPNGCEARNRLVSDVPARSKIYLCIKAELACPSAYGYAIYCGTLRAR
jgi:hypothetical protein